MQQSLRQTVLTTQPCHRISRGDGQGAAVVVLCRRVITRLLGNGGQHSAGLRHLVITVVILGLRHNFLVIRQQILHQPRILARKGGQDIARHTRVFA